MVMDETDYTSATIKVITQDFFGIAKEMVSMSFDHSPCIFTTDLCKLTDMIQLRDCIQAHEAYEPFLEVHLVGHVSICCKLQLRNNYNESDEG
jgi:hypothetical protein